EGKRGRPRSPGLDRRCQGPEKGRRRTCLARPKERRIPLCQERRRCTGLHRDGDHAAARRPTEGRAEGQEVTRIRPAHFDASNGTTDDCGVPPVTWTWLCLSTKTLTSLRTPNSGK